jgi:hypothetical protein
LSEIGALLVIAQLCVSQAIVHHQWRWVVGWITVLLTALLGVAVHGADEVRVFTYSKDDVGGLPKGWKAEKTGDGEGSVWKVVADETAPSKTGYVLAQTAEGPRRLFNVCVVGDVSRRDLELSVKLKAVHGKIDQGGGVVWRYQDANNYYVCRYNPLEENLRLYKVVQGKRIQLQSKESLGLPSEKWISLSVKHVGNRIECSLDGTKRLEATDGTFQQTGKVGLWTKADAVTYFDLLTIRAE